MLGKGQSTQRNVQFTFIILTRFFSYKVLTSASLSAEAQSNILA